jgi:ABC-2 type transport system ATP-binding protein
MGSPAVAVDRLRVVRGDTVALDGVSVRIAAGRVTGLIGPSGSGKTTLLRSIVGAQRVAAGSVTVLERSAGSPALRRTVAYTTQHPAVYPDLTVRETVAFFARVLGAPAGAVEEALAAVSLTALGSRLVASLSGGEQARVSLATALIGRPAVLVLDEPTVGLDPVLRRDLWALFRRLAGEGATLLVSSHVMDEAERCHDLILLREGRVLATGTPDELRRRAGAADLDDVFLRLIEAEATG